METPPTLSTNEQEKLLRSLRGHSNHGASYRKGIRNRLIGLLMLDAGLRVGEVVALEMSDLYFNGKPVSNIVLRPAITKNHKERIVPVSERLSFALVDYTSENSFLNHCSGSSFAFSFLMSSRPISTRQVERIIKSAAMKVLGRPVHPHVLRHTFASKLMRVTNIRTVQELLGHTNITSTQIYTHPNSDDLRSAIDRLNDSEPV